MYSSMSSLIIFFFFQAEDGIRDGHVTGVQTCALPICAPPRKAASSPISTDQPSASASSSSIMSVKTSLGCAPATGVPPTRNERSEEHTSELQSRGHLVCRPPLEKEIMESQVGTRPRRTR